METNNNFIDNNIVKPNLVIVLIVCVIPIYTYDISFIMFFILTLSGIVEKNPGPNPTRRQQCRMLYTNIRGSRHYDILLCSEKLVSGMRHASKVLIPGSKKPSRDGSTY